MRGRGFSVIEVMIAAGILAVLAALVMPAALGHVATRSLVQSGEDLGAGLALAGAEASETGLALAVRLRRGADGSWRVERASLRAPDDLQMLETSDAPTPTRSRAGVTARDEIVWRPLLALPAGVTVSREAPPSDQPAPDLRRPAGGDAPGSLLESDADARDDDTLLVGVFLPGGRFVGEGALYLAREDEPVHEAVVVSVSTWTGRVRLAEWRAADPADVGDAETPEESRLEDWLGEAEGEGEAP